MNLPCKTHVSVSFGARGYFSDPLVKWPRCHALQVLGKDLETASHLLERTGVGCVWWFIFIIFIFLFSPKDTFSLLLERKEERKGKRNIDAEREASIGYLPYTPGPGINPKPRHAPWPGIEPANFRWQDDAPTKWASQGWFFWLFIF